MKVTGRISFHFENIKAIPFPRKQTREWIVFIIHNENASLDCLNFILCDDSTLLDYNIKYLSHDTLTDIITFDYNEIGGGITGDIFISIERVRENASKFNVDFRREFYRVIFHGLLHLVGYDDKDRISKKRMREREDFYLDLFIDHHKS